VNLLRFLSGKILTIGHWSGVLRNGARRLRSLSCARGNCLPNYLAAAIRERAEVAGVGFYAWGYRVCLKWENYRLSPPLRVQRGLSRHPPRMRSLSKPKSRLLSGPSASDLTVSTKTETIGKVTIAATIEAGPVVK
jgi:hypothetical protein